MKKIYVVEQVWADENTATTHRTPISIHSTREGAEADAKALDAKLTYRGSWNWGYEVAEWDLLP